MQYAIWCVVCGIITAGSLCAALGAEKRAQEAEARIEAAGYFYKVQKEIAEKANGAAKAAVEKSSDLMVALKNETAERARIERAYNGVVEKNEALERRVNELEAELAKKQKVLDYIADAEKGGAIVPTVSPQVSQLIEAVLQETQDFLEAADGPGDPAPTAGRLPALPTEGETDFSLRSK